MYLHEHGSKSSSVSLSVCGLIKLTSWLWRTAAHQLELEVVGAKILALQVLEQLPESRTNCVSAVQAVSIQGLFNLEVFVLTHGGRLDQVELEAETQSVSLKRYKMAFIQGCEKKGRQHVNSCLTIMPDTITNLKKKKKLDC